MPKSNKFTVYTLFESDFIIIIQIIIIIIIIILTLFTEKNIEFSSYLMFFLLKSQLLLRNILYWPELFYNYHLKSII